MTDFVPHPHCPGAVLGKNGHAYPSAHTPGTHWATDEAWQILDVAKPGAIADDLRFLLAGLIAGRLLRMAGTKP
jgi:hypothetical protein